MDKKVKMVSFWNYELQELVDFLKDMRYNEQVTRHLEDINNAN